MNSRPDKPGLNREQRRKKQKRRKPGDDLSNIRIAIILLILTALLVIVAVAVFTVPDILPAPLDPITWACNVCLLSALEIVLVLVGVMLYRFCKSHPSFGILETVFTLGMERLRKNLALKNAHQIFPALQYFLYIVLRRNRDILGIDPGPDFHALSPNGKGAACRNHTVYYTYELVALASPGIDINTLKQILNQLITAEVNNYGIVNLPSQFVSPFNGRVYQSVYLDRLTYDEVRHVLIFEMLFVGSRPAASALEKAVERDRPKPPPSIPDIFDDEV